MAARCSSVDFSEESDGGGGAEDPVNALLDLEEALRLPFLPRGMVVYILMK